MRYFEDIWKKISNKLYFSVLFLFLLKEFVSNNSFYVIIVCLILLSIALNRRINFKVIAIFIPIFLIQVVLAFLNFSSYGTTNIIRDIVYFTYPLLIIILGGLIYNKYQDKAKFFNSVIFYALISSIWYIILFLTTFLRGSTVIGDLRDYGFIGTISAIVLAVLSSEKMRKHLNISDRYFIICLAFIGIAFLVSFSRTNVISLVLALFAVNLFPIREFKNKIRNIFWIILFSVLILVGMFFIVPDLVLDFINKIFRSFTELNSKSDWTKEYNIVHNWRGYEVYKALIMHHDALPINKMFGFGFGKGIYIGEYAYLVLENSKGDIPVLHNGYYTMLIKAGIVGTFTYIFFYLSKFINACKKLRGDYNISAIIVIVIIIILSFSTIFVTGMFYADGAFHLTLLLGYFITDLSKKKNKEILYEGNSIGRG